MDPNSYADQQRERAAEGRADGQCPCGSYRLDGKPPVLHYPGCPHKDDHLEHVLDYVDQQA